MSGENEPNELRCECSIGSWRIILLYTRKEYLVGRRGLHALVKIPPRFQRSDDGFEAQRNWCERCSTKRKPLLESDGDRHCSRRLRSIQLPFRTSSERYLAI